MLVLQGESGVGQARHNQTNGKQKEETFMSPRAKISRRFIIPSLILGATISYFTAESALTSEESNPYCKCEQHCKACVLHCNEDCESPHNVCVCGMKPQKVRTGSGTQYDPEGRGR